MSTDESTAAEAQIASRPSFEDTKGEYTKVIAALANAIAGSIDAQWSMFKDTWVGCEAPRARSVHLSASIKAPIPDDKWESVLNLVRKTAADMGATEYTEFRDHNIQFASSTGASVRLRSDANTVVSLRSDCRRVAQAATQPS
ncbi:MAG: LppA family lipoprotein [Gordonia sp. (in: high G+C Gram-positive bacteria)]